MKVKVISLPYIFQVLYVLCFTRPRYQVSVYRTIGPLVFCSNDDPVLILTYFTARSNFATSALIWENVTMMDTLEIIASCDLEFGLLCKLND